MSHASPPNPLRSRPTSVTASFAREARHLSAKMALALTLGFGLAGLSGAATAADITMVTDFGINGRHAYFFLAQEKGYYKEAGLNVTIVRGGGSADAIKKVAAGAAQIGFADAAALVLARGNDGIPVKLVSVVYQNAPQAIYAIESSGIKGPQDLVGRKVADSASSAIPLLFGAYAKAAGIPKDQVTWVIADGGALPAMLATGRIDAIGQYIVGEPLLQKAVAPQKLVRMAYKDAGLNLYGNGLIVSEEMLKSDPASVRAFVAATLRGMQEAFRDPAAAGALMNSVQKQVDAQVAEGETRAVAELATTPGQPLGHIDAARMQGTVDTIAAAFTLKRPVSAAEMYAPGFEPK